MNARTLTPLGWLVAGVALLIAIGFIAWGWNNMWSWLPWSDERQLDRAEARADTAESDASARKLESQGQAEGAVIVNWPRALVDARRSVASRAKADELIHRLRALLEPSSTAPAKAAAR